MFLPLILLFVLLCCCCFYLYCCCCLCGLLFFFVAVFLFLLALFCFFCCLSCFCHFLGRRPLKNPAMAHFGQIHFGHNLQLNQFGPILVGPSRFWPTLPTRFGRFGPWLGRFFVGWLILVGPSPFWPTDPALRRTALRRTLSFSFSHPFSIFSLWGSSRGILVVFWSVGTSNPSSCHVKPKATTRFISNNFVFQMLVVRHRLVVFPIADEHSFHQKTPLQWGRNDSGLPDG